MKKLLTAVLAASVISTNAAMGASAEEYVTVTFDPNGVEAFEPFTLKLVKNTASYICRNGKVWLLFPLFWKSGCKYIGYFLGKHYRRLPGVLDRSLCLNKEYWKRMEKQLPDKI